MRILIDTGVLWSREALANLRDHEGDLVLPAVAYAERVRQLRRQKRSTTEFDAWLGESAIIVEAFGPWHARNLPANVEDEQTWRRLGRDALIAAHLEPGDVLWTTNPKDFRTLGVAEEQLFAVG